MTYISGSGLNNDIIYIRYNNNYIQYAKNNDIYKNITNFPINIINDTPTTYLDVQFTSNIIITNS